MSKSGLLALLIFGSGFFGGAARAEHLAETVTLGGTVSVEELRNPLTGKSLRMILDAQRDLRSGQHDRAMGELRQALADPRAMPYAIGMLGSEHLKANQLDIAIGELEQAVHLLSAHAELHSNLALALGLHGEYDRALVEARKALQLDPAGTKTRFVLGRILMARPETAEEGVAHMKMIAADFPAARVALAAYYNWKGRREKQAAVLSFR